MITPYRYRLGTTYRNHNGEELSNLSQVDVAYHIYKHSECIYYITKYVELGCLRQMNLGLYNQETPMKPEDIIGNYETVKEIYGDFPLDNFDISVINKFNGDKDEDILPYQYRIGSTLNNEKGEEIQNLSQVNVADYITKFPQHIYYISKYVDQGFLRSIQFGLYYSEIHMEPKDIIDNYHSMKDIYGYYPLDNFDISVIKMFNGESHTLKQIVNSDKKCIIVQSKEQNKLDDLKKEIVDKLKDKVSIDSGLLFFTNNLGNWIDRYEYLHQLSKTKNYLFFEEGVDFNISNIASRSFLREILGGDQIFYRQLFKDGQSFNTRHMKVIIFCKKIPVELSVLNKSTEVIRL